MTSYRQCELREIPAGISAREGGSTRMPDWSRASRLAGCTRALPNATGSRRWITSSATGLSN